MARNSSGGFVTVFQPLVSGDEAVSTRTGGRVCSRPATTSWKGAGSSGRGHSKGVLTVCTRVCQQRGWRRMSHEDSFDELMARLKAGDEAAETLVFRRYVRRLIALAGRQFEADLRDKADVEGVVQSVCKSFFLRQRRGEFDIDDWDDSGQNWPRSRSASAPTGAIICKHPGEPPGASRAGRCRTVKVSGFRIEHPPLLRPRSSRRPSSSSSSRWIRTIDRSSSRFLWVTAPRKWRLSSIARMHGASGQAKSPAPAGAIDFAG